jgi:CARDB
MNNHIGKRVRLGAPLLAIFILFAAGRATALAQRPPEIKSGKSSAERGAPVLLLESLAVDPAKPGPKTLCELRARIRNKGGQAATSFLFEVRINGQEQTVYKNHAYMQPIAAGAVGEVQLFNFWTTESGRPPPNGQLRIEVALKEARWVEVTRHGNATDEKLQGNVEGLPVSAGWAITLGTADRRRGG